MACALRLRGFADLFNRPVQPGVTFATEFSDRVRVIACLTGRPFMIHSDIEGYGLRNSEWQQIRKALKAKRGDEVVVLWGPSRDVDTGVREIFIRAREALEGIPPETRQAFRDGTTGFERILPGADRMYPDTDTPPVAVHDEWIEEILADLPERPWGLHSSRALTQTVLEPHHPISGEIGLLPTVSTPDLPLKCFWRQRPLKKDSFLPKRLFTVKTERTG